LPVGADVIIFNTASREGDAVVARERAREAALRLLGHGVSLIYKKMDSVLRGHPGPELSGVLDAIVITHPGARALVAPAFPAQGRTTVDGVQLVHGVPVAAHLGRLDHALAPVFASCDIRDSTTDDDLRVIARDGVAGERILWVGSAGLASQVVEAFRVSGAASETREVDTWSDAPDRSASSGEVWNAVRPERVIVVAGTVHPATVLQVETLVADGWDHIAFDIGDPDGWPDEREVLRAMTNSSTSGVVVSTHANLSGHSHPDEVIDPSLVRNAVTLLDRIAPIVSALLMDGRTGLVVTGGETAQHLFTGIGVTSVDVFGEALPGIPIGVMEFGGVRVRVATKSGGFGGSDALRHVCRVLVS
jgi:uncharacterized protein YgbK (DUF1537 family)